MLRRTQAIVFGLLWVAASMLGCAAPNYNTDKTQACANGHQDDGETDVDCGGTNCPSCAEGKKCSLPSDCSLGNCVDGICNATPCTDLKLDGNETAIDCGGANQCPRCSNGKACLVATDCSGGICLDKFCNDTPCQDGKKDGSETDIDCGGGQCPGCGDGKACLSGSDCAANTPCTNGKCENPLCHDSKKDGSETDIDCGGSCVACGLGKACLLAADCVTLNCDGLFCSAPTCTDGSKNQGESAVDCGDPTRLCKRCLPGDSCTDPSSCQSGICLVVNGVGTCAAPSCNDTLMNGDETDVDCGGSCAQQSPAKLCADTRGCSSDEDCQSKVCKVDTTTSKGTCQKPTCPDGKMNGDETGVDCGGTVTCTVRCGANSGCVTGADCASDLVCTNLLCQTPHCSNTIQDSTETDLNCGGGDCVGCATGQKCADGYGTRDCQDKICTNGKCAAPSCTDTVQNGNETDLNCGGGACGKCVDGKGCQVGDDCVSGVCNSGKCATPSCTDGVQNSSETSVDCAGGCPIAISKYNQHCGISTPCSSDADCASPNVCSVTGSCSTPTCNDRRKDQTETDVDCGGICATLAIPQLCANTLHCASKSDCMSGVCNCTTDSVCITTAPGNTCNAPSCSDAVQNGDETGVDCGGSCANLGKKCGNGASCKKLADCQSGVCNCTDTAGVCDTTKTSNTCLVPDCTDTVANGDETDVDCGGSCVAQGKLCGDARICKVNSDCANNSCSIISGSTGTCLIQVCTDGKQEPPETDIDCGGGTCTVDCTGGGPCTVSCGTNPCARCADAKSCVQDTDCKSRVCSTANKCVAAICPDGRKNGTETGLDCGGPISSCATRCGTDGTCLNDSDCVSGKCTNGVCQAPTCSDGIKNGGELDIDCLGTACPTKLCGLGQTCNLDTNCTTGWCKPATTAQPNTCSTPGCPDGFQNQGETGLDCGGSICTTRCPAGQPCKVNGDCASPNWCKGGSCVADSQSCSDTFLNNGETGVDCGGINCANGCKTAYNASCKQCGVGSACTANLDCQSLNCSGLLCAAPTHCVAKELNGQGPVGCGLCAGLTNASDIPLCKSYLLCYFLNNCNPITGKDVNGINCVGNSAVCGLNAIGGGNAPQSAANASYTCACP